MIEKNDVKKIIKHTGNKENIHKYSRGRTTIYAGSYNYPGAAMLSARAACKTGSGYVDLFIYFNQQTSTRKAFDSLITSVKSSYPDIIIHHDGIIHGDDYDNILFYIRIVCATYLFYLGIKSILSQNINWNHKIKTEYSIVEISPIVSYRDGFITNVLNVKATFFFLSLYVYLDTALIAVRIFYGLWMAIITGLWFILLSIILTSQKINENTYNYQFYINKLMGIVLIYLAIKIYLNY